MLGKRRDRPANLFMDRWLGSTPYAGTCWLYDIEVARENGVLGRWSPLT